MELLAGGLAAGMRPSDFDPEQLRIGTEVELEHTGDWLIAREIAMDHLAESPDYYRELAKMEARLEEQMGRYERNSPGWGTIWAIAATAALGASAYHGYKRHEQDQPIMWAAIWGLMGALVPPVTVGVAIAQGFGKPIQSQPLPAPPAPGNGASGVGSYYAYPQLS